MTTRVKGGIKFLTALVELYQKNIPARFHQDWPTSKGGEYVQRIVDRQTDGHWTTTDHNTSP